MINKEHTFVVHGKCVAVDGGRSVTRARMLHHQVVAISGVGSGLSLVLAGGWHCRDVWVAELNAACERAVVVDGE